MAKSERITKKNHDQLWGLKDARIEAEAHKNDNTKKRNSTGVSAKDKEIVMRNGPGEKCLKKMFEGNALKNA